jgi:hypothetical protein
MPISRRSTAEFVGTFWLVFGGCGSAVLAAGFPGLGIGFLVSCNGSSLKDYLACGCWSYGVRELASAESRSSRWSKLRRGESGGKPPHSKKLPELGNELLIHNTGGRVVSPLVSIPSSYSIKGISDDRKFADS